MDGNKSFMVAGFVAGIQDNSADFTIGPVAIMGLPLTRLTRNVSHGRLDGLSSRYGISPIPGHCTTTQEFTANYPNNASSTPTPFGGLMCSEQTLGAAAYTTARAAGADVYDQRKAILGVFLVQVDVDPISINRTIDADTMPQRKVAKVPYWITTRTNASTYVDGARRFDACPPVTQGDGINANSPLFTRLPRFEGSIGHGAAVINMLGTTNANYNTYDSRQKNQLNTSLQTMNIGALHDHLILKNNPTATWYMRSASIKKDIAQLNKDFVLTVPASSSINTAVGGANYTLTVRTREAKFYGYPPLWVSKTNSNKTLNLNIFAFGAGYELGAYNYGYGKNVALEKISREYSATFRNYEYGDGNALVPASYDRAGTSYLVNLTSPTYAPTLLNTINSTFYWNGSTSSFSTAVSGDFNFMVIDGKASCALFIDRFRNPAQRESDAFGLHANVWYNVATGYDYTDDSLIYIDPCNNEFKPKDLVTSVGGTNYKEGSIEKNTAFNYFFDETTNNANVVIVGAYDAVLEPTKSYQFSYSLYNSLTGKESNVGTLATALVPAGAANDTAYLTLSPFAGYNYDDVVEAQKIPGVSGVTTNVVRLPVQWRPHINHLKYRFFYREFGAFEWLLAGEYDAAKLYNVVTTRVNTSPSAKNPALRQPSFGRTGGQAGGFNDFSDLENDVYVDVATFQGRVFWCSKTSIRFSLKNDVLSYPLRNTASIESGELRGLLVHYFQGQAEQNGRLLVFANDGYYEGRFSGNVQTQAVQVSLTAAPIVVPVDGSDFVISQRSTEIAFSSRCAVVAEGVVYFMGPRGIFRDDGVQVPQRVSQAIEPAFHEMYDHARTGEFFGHYNGRTREILFYFRPVSDSVLNPQAAKTMAWVYPLRIEQWPQQVGAWTLNEYDCVIDWAQDVDTTGFQVAAKAAGMRTVIGVRDSTASTTSRAYYHDESCEGGDMTPGKEFVVGSIGELTTGRLRLGLAGGFSSAALTAVVAGTTKIGITNSQTYGKAATGLYNLEETIFNAATQNLDGLHLVLAKGANWIEVAKPAGFVITASVTYALQPGQMFPVFVEGYHAVRSFIDSSYLTPEGLFGFHQFRKFHALIQPVALGAGTQESRAQVGWNAPHEYPATDDVKSFPISPLNVRERTTQVVVDLYNNEMSSQGQGLRLNLTYNQIYGRFTLYTFTVYYGDVGDDNLMMYQRDNA